MKVKCVNNKDNGFFECDKNSPLLKVGEEYEVDEIETHSWHTEIFLSEFENIPFNSICFEEE